MTHRREFAVGASIILAAVLFFVGIRFFEGIPVFRGTYALYTTFQDAQGLAPGNAVRVRGVDVGTVDAVEIDADQQVVRVRFQIDSKVAVPQGSTAQIAGISALNGVRMDIRLGRATNPAIEAGGFVPSERASSLGDLTERAPVLIDRLESVLEGAGATFEQTRRLLETTGPELSHTLQSVRSTSESLDQTVRAQQVRLATTMEHLEVFSAALRAFTDENADSIGLLVSRMNHTFDRLGQNMTALETASESLNNILGQLDAGESTAARLVNDPMLYVRLDSTLTALNRLIVDFQTNPGRYFQELELIDIF